MFGFSVASSTSKSATSSQRGNPLDPEHARAVLRQLVRSQSPSERHFERLCRDYVNRSGLPHRLRRETIRNIGRHGLSAHNLAVLHEVCGVRFGSLVWELLGIDLNHLARWHASAYPEQTIRLPDYLWNPEFTFACPVQLNADVLPAHRARLDSLVLASAELPLGCLAGTGESLKMFRIGDGAMRPVFHPGDLVFVRLSKAPPDVIAGDQRLAMIELAGRLLPCWLQPARMGGTQFVWATGQCPSSPAESPMVRWIGPIVGFWKDLRPRPGRSPSSIAPPQPQSSQEPVPHAAESGLAHLIRQFRAREGVTIKSLIERLDGISDLLPAPLAAAIPAASSLSAMEYQEPQRPSLARLVLLSIALRCDLRVILRAAGIAVSDAGKIPVAERLQREPQRSSPMELAERCCQGVLGHPVAAALAARWKDLPWLAPLLLGEFDPGSVYYMGRRGRFTHPMVSDQCFLLVDRKRAAPQHIPNGESGKDSLDGWPRMFLVEVRATGELLCGECRREGSLLYFMGHDQFGGQRLSFDLGSEVLVIGEVTGLASAVPDLAM